MRLLRSPVVRRAAVVTLAVLVLIQFVPYGRVHSNPAVTSAVAWPTPGSERLARDACYACHSNETDWPWYSEVAPMSWLVRRDVDSGREELNFSTGDVDADDAADSVRNGSMPPPQYLLLHPEARLSAVEKAELVAALEAVDRLDDNRGSGSPGRD